MPHWKKFGLAIFAALCLLGETVELAHARCTDGGGVCATEWTDGKVINLGSLPGSVESLAHAINDAGQVVGFSTFYSTGEHATE
jgi:uncharacterized membrane protein